MPPPVEPGVGYPRGYESYGDNNNVVFVATGVGTEMEFVWRSPIFALRPGLDWAERSPANAIPINHEAALGLSHYLNVLFASRGGLFPPATVAGLTAFLTEVGNTVNTGRMFAVTKETEITDSILDGGDQRSVWAQAPPSNNNPPSGASVISITPAFPGLRFWGVEIRLHLDAPVAGLDLFVLPMIH